MGDFSIVLFRPNFMLVSEEHPALHQKSLLHRVFRCKNRTLWSRKTFKMRPKRSY